jgi:hypothetical protein
MTLNIRSRYSLIAPGPYVAIDCQSGNTYTADANGFISLSAIAAGNAYGNDYIDLLKAGCVTYNGGTGQLLGKLLGASLNSTAGTLQPFSMETPAAASFRVEEVIACNPEGTITAAVVKVLDASAGGTVSTATTLSSLTGTAGSPGAGCAQNLSMSSTSSSTTYAGNTLYLDIGTSTGSTLAAAADFYAFGTVFA